MHPTKQELIDALRENGAHAVERLRAAPESAFEQGRYENGWNARQILAHVASIEWTYPRLIDIAKGAGGAESPKPARMCVKPDSTSRPRASATRPVRGGILDYNDRQVEKRAGASVA